MSISYKQSHQYCKNVVGEYGTLSRRVCVCIPKCMVEFICGLFPEPIGKYMGHRDVNKKRNDIVEGNNDSFGNKETFECVLPQGKLRCINLDQ